MKCVKGLGFLWVAVLAASFALSACDDSSSASEDNNETSVVESSSSSSHENGKSSDSKTKQSPAAARSLIRIATPSPATANPTIPPK